MPGQMSERLSRMRGVNVTINLRPGETLEDAENRVISENPDKFRMSTASELSRAKIMGQKIGEVDQLGKSLGNDKNKIAQANSLADLNKKLGPSEKAEAGIASAESLRNSMGLLANSFAAMQSDEPWPFNKIPVGSSVKRLTHKLSGSKDLMNLFGKDQNDAIETYQSQIGGTALKKLAEMSGGGAGSARLASRAEQLVPDEYADWGSFAQKFTALMQDLEGTRAANAKEDFDPAEVQKAIDGILQRNMPPDEFSKFQKSNFYRGLAGTAQQEQPGGVTSPGVTHRWNPETGTLDPL